MTQSHQLINQDSGNYEYYTPLEIVNAARWVMGGIDLDPASSREANRRVLATRYFDEQINGLYHRWSGRVWMNHPFSRTANKIWPAKLCREYLDGHIDQACSITFAATSEEWFQCLAAFPQCYLSPRTNYYLPDGTKKRGVTKGSVVTYLGPNVDRFASAFKPFGRVKVVYDAAQQ